MDWTTVRLCALLELAVVVFQVLGILALVALSLCPCPRIGDRVRTAVVLALVGLGVAGACCGVHDSEFGPFAGLTMTTLLIGLTVGGGNTSTPPPLRAGAEVASH